MARLNKPTSPYYTTPVKDFYLDVWQSRNIPPNANDRLVTITPEYEKRPDLMANEFYGTPRLWWVFAVRNKNLLIDPIEDFTAGLTIFVPTPETIEEII